MNKYILYISFFVMSLFFCIPTRAVTETIVNENPGLENWSGSPPAPEYWLIFATGINVSEETSTTFCYDPPCAKVVTVSSNPQFSFYQQINECNPGDIIWLAYHGRKYDGGGSFNPTVYFASTDFTQQWRFDLGSWTAGDFSHWDTIGTISSSEWIVYDQHTLQSEWTHPLQCPSNGMFVLLFSFAPLNGDIAFFDDVTLTTYEEESTTTPPISIATTTPLLTHFVNTFWYPVSIVGGTLFFFALFIGVWQFAVFSRKQYTKF